MLDRRKDLKVSISILTSSVRGKQNVAREPVMVRIESSELETGNEPQKTALSTIESW